MKLFSCFGSSASAFVAAVALLASNANANTKQRSEMQADKEVGIKSGTARFEKGLFLKLLGFVGSPAGTTAAAGIHGKDYYDDRFIRNNNGADDNIGIVDEERRRRRRKLDDDEASESSSSSLLLPDLSQKVNELGSMDSFISAFAGVGFLNAVSEPNGPFTVFMPTTDAMKALGEDLLSCLVDPKRGFASLQQILLYHVAEGNVVSSDLEHGQKIQTLLEGGELTVNFIPSGGGSGIGIQGQANDAIVVTPDAGVASNGVIHTIDTVLRPPNIDELLLVCDDVDEPDEQEQPLPDLPKKAQELGLDILVSAFSVALFTDAALAPNGPFTIFAPTDDAFKLWGEDRIDCLVDPKRGMASLQHILLYHVAMGTVPLSDLEDGQKIPTLLEGKELTVEFIPNGGGGIKIVGQGGNDAVIVASDGEASNGVIHTIDTVLLPPNINELLSVCDDGSQSKTKPLPDLPSKADELGLEHFVSAFSAALLTDAALEPNGPFTIFGPINSAIAGWEKDTINCFLDPKRGMASLQQILLYHVAIGTSLLSNLEDGQKIATLLPGGELTVNFIPGGGIEIEGQVNKAVVISPDEEASNGVIHILDTILLPPNIDELMSACNDGSQSKTKPLPDLPHKAQELGLNNFLTTFSATLLTDAALEPNGPFTIFGPIDSAIGGWEKDTIDCFLDPKRGMASLQQILLYHVAIGTSLLSNLEDGQKITTLLPGGELTVNFIPGGGIEIEGQVNKAVVISPDEEASNGVIHILDTILLPPNIDELMSVCANDDERNR